jgi:hypothetical protein
MHAKKITLFANQLVYPNGQEVNMHDIESIMVDDNFRVFNIQVVKDITPKLQYYLDEIGSCFNQFADFYQYAPSEYL